MDELEECAGQHSAWCSTGGGQTADVRPCACAHSLHVATLQPLHLHEMSVSSGGTVANLQIHYRQIKIHYRQIKQCPYV